METFIIIAAAVVVIAVISFLRTYAAYLPDVSKTKNTYRYEVKNKLMTQRELLFYAKLTNVAGDKYAVVPQVHLSAFLNHKIKGQNWKGAFSVINGKSVDYLFVDKSTQKPTIAIELDDYSHQSEARIERDRRVENIMTTSGMRLVRFSDVNISEDQIFTRLIENI